MLEIEPNPGGGVAFAERIVGGVVPKNFFPGVEKGVRDVAEKGPVAGYPVIDFKATLYDRSFHNVDSDELSFGLAGSQATRKGIQDDDPVLLEPIVRLTVSCPEEVVGDVIGDLNSRRGHPLGMEPKGSMTEVKAEVPMAEMQQYAAELRSLTSGRGTYEIEFDHYAEVPHIEAQQVIEAARSADE